MSLLTYLIIVVASGALVGALARLSLLGPDPMTLPPSILLGIAGNAVAGIAAGLLWYDMGGDRYRSPAQARSSRFAARAGAGWRGPGTEDLGGGPLARRLAMRVACLRQPTG